MAEGIRDGVEIRPRYSDRLVQTAASPTAIRPWLRPLYFVGGTAFLIVGIAGVFLPLVPTTGPMILATFLYARSSSRLHRWLVTHPRFGRLVSDFEHSRAIPRRAKIIAVTSMTLAFGYTIGWVATHPIARLAVFVVAVWALWYVLRLPTIRQEARD
jgi:uncharacterized membrane protein YbaN (DUF454 family)